MKKDLTTEEVVKIKTNAKASKLVLGFKKEPYHFNLLKATISKIESMSGVQTSIPSDYKSPTK